MPFITGYEVLTTVVDVAGTPDTTLIGNADGYPVNTSASDMVDFFTKGGGAGRDMRVTHMELIFTHSHGSDADGTSSVYELMGRADGGPRELICTLALVGGKARRTASSDLVTWVDTITVTDMRTTDIVIRDNSATDSVCRARIKLQGLRYWEGLFTGAGSTAVTAIAYYRLYSETE